MFEVHRKIIVQYIDRRLIWNMYKIKIAVIKIGNHQEEVVIRKGFGQGFALSPLIFNATFKLTE